MKKIFIVLLVLALLFIVTLYFVKIDTSQENSIMIEAEIIEIFEGPSYDILFRLRNNSNNYYINRGIESGLVVKDLNNDLLFTEVKIWYADHWIGSPYHITRLESDTVYYSE